MNVVIMGGLGNQFFQIAYAHELVGRFSSRRVNLVPRGPSQTLSRFLNLSVVGELQSSRFQGESFFTYRLDNFVARIFKFKTLVRYILKLLRFFSEEHCGKPFNRAIFFKGYFQNFEFSKTTITLMEHEIVKVLERSSVVVPSLGYAVFICEGAIIYLRNKVCCLLSIIITF